MTGSKWRIGIVLQAQLDTLSYRVACGIGHYAEAKIDTRRDAARRNQVSILHDAFLFVCRTNQRQQLGKGPVRGCAAPLEQSSSTENEGPGTHQGHVLRRARLPLNECYRLPIAHRPHNTGGATRYADQIQARAVLECVRGDETEAAVARHRSC